jgi:hypothetical protein
MQMALSPLTRPAHRNLKDITVLKLWLLGDLQNPQAQKVLKDLPTK